MNEKGNGGIFGSASQSKKLLAQGDTFNNIWSHHHPRELIDLKRTYHMMIFNQDASDASVRANEVHALQWFWYHAPCTEKLHSNINLQHQLPMQFDWIFVCADNIDEITYSTVECMHVSKDVMFLYWARCTLFILILPYKIRPFAIFTAHTRTFTRRNMPVPLLIERRLHRRMFYYLHKNAFADAQNAKDTFLILIPILVSVHRTNFMWCASVLSFLPLQLRFSSPNLLSWS